MSASFQTRAYAFHAHDGLNLESCDASISVKATSEQTAGGFNLFEVTLPPGYATPLHIHYAEHVALYVLEGALTVFWGSETKDAAVGSYFFQPRGTPHGFRVDGAEPARMLYMTFPSGFDRFVLEHSQTLDARASEATAARHQIEILGPLPE